MKAYILAKVRQVGLTIQFTQQVWRGCLEDLDGPVALAERFVGPYSVANDLGLAG